MSLFQKGMAKTGGRAKGTRNKISQRFLEDLAAEWEVSGPDALKVMAKTDCPGFVKVVAALLPKEFEITETQLMAIPDEELDAFIEFARRRIAERALSIGVRTSEAVN
jgi:hypothetical protein